MPLMDLCNDVEELQGMTRLLIDDVKMLRPKIGEGNPDPSDDAKAYRRFYVRAVFALVEAFVEQHRRLVIHLCEAGKIALSENKLNQLRQIRRILDAGGAVVRQEPNYMRIFDKIKEVYKMGRLLPINALTSTSAVPAPEPAQDRDHWNHVKWA